MHATHQADSAPASTALPALGLVAANLIWAAGYPITAVALRDIPASLLTVIRLGLGALVLLPLLRPRDGRHWDTRAATLALILGLVGFALPVYLQTVGLSVSTPAITAILVALEPLFTAVLAALLLREPLPPLRQAALAVALLGAWIIAGVPRPGHAGYLWGDLLLLLSIACFAIYNAFSARLASRVPATAAAAGTLVAGFAATLPIWLLAGVPLPHRVGPGPLAATLYMAVVATGLCYLLWMLAVVRMPVAQAALFLYLQPVFGVALSVAVAGARPGWVFYVGSTLVLAGVFLGEARMAPATAEAD